MPPSPPQPLHPQALAPSVPGLPKAESQYAAAPQKATRISHACQMCKIRKTKCDGKTPCWRCQTRHTDCNYDSSDRRRARSLLLKDFNMIRDNMKSYDKLMELICNSDEDGALHALGLIRSRSHANIHELVEQLEIDSTGTSSHSPSSSHDADAQMPDDRSSTSGSKRRRSESVARSARGASVSQASESSQVSPTSAAFDGSPTITVPSAGVTPDISAVSSPQCSSSTIESAFSMFSMRPHPTLSKVPGTNGFDVLQVAINAPCLSPSRNYSVLPKLWTNVSNDAVFVSHLVSLASAWNQPLHGFIDLEAFVGDAAAPDGMNWKFCSPLLFNSVLAISCLFCIHDEAFVDALEPMSRGEHFIAEAKKLLSHGRPTSSASMENITRVQSLPLIALFEASRMRTAAAWNYTGWFFNACLGIGLPETPDRSACPSDEKWRLGQMAVAYALFLTDRLWFTYTAYVQKLILSGSPPYSIANLFPAASIANRRATIGPSSIPRKLFSDEQTPPAADPRMLPSRRNSSGLSQAQQRPLSLRMDTDMHDGNAERLDLGVLVRKLQGVTSAEWDDSTMNELLMLHGKLELWMRRSSGKLSGGGGGSLARAEDAQMLTGGNGPGMGSVDPCILQLPD